MSTNPIDTNLTQPNGTAGGVTLSPFDPEVVMEAIDTIRQKLPFLLNLTPKKRKGLAKLGDKNRAFVMKAVDVATQNPDALPRSHSVQDVQNIAELFGSMTGIRLALQQLYKQVDDTTTKIGSDAYAVARTIYIGTKSPVAGARLATAANNLGRRFGRKSKPAESSAVTLSDVSAAKPEMPLPSPPSPLAAHT